MPAPETLLIFAALSVGLAATPGPNMLYLVSRALAQGTAAGLVSLAGCQFGSLVIMLCAAAGLTAALFAVPYAWDVLRIGGAAYLAFLAWQCLRPGGQPIFAPRAMPREPAARLFSVGFATAALNPKVALFYMAVLPPFIDPALGSVFMQGAVLGAVMIYWVLGLPAIKKELTTGRKKPLVRGFDFRPAAIIERLDLLRPLYRRTTNYGHFGKPDLPWEQ